MEGEVIDVVSSFAELLERWKTEDQRHGDTTDCLKSIAEHLEKSLAAFYKHETDLFDVKESVTALPDCSYAQLLTTLESQEELLEQLLPQTMSDLSSFEFRCQAARVMLNILTGSQTITKMMEDAESYIPSLFKWCKDGKEPLSSYSAGILGNAMELSKCVSLFERQNSELVPIVLTRLKLLKNVQKLSSAAVENYDTLPAKPKRTSAAATTSENHKGKPDASSQATSDSQPEHGAKERKSHKRQSTEPSHSKKSYNRSPDYSLYPLTVGMQQRLLLRYLQPLGLYQELLPIAIEHSVIELGMHYIHLKKQKDAFIALEALKYIGSLLCHKKLGVDFVNQGGISRILEIPKHSFVSAGVALCLYVIVYNKDAMEEMCLLQDDVLAEIVKYTLWLLERSHDSARSHATLFFSVAFSYRGVLDLFDQMDGLRMLTNMVATLEVLQADVAPLLADNDDLAYNSRKTIRQTCTALARYFEMHVAISANKIKQALSRFKYDIVAPPPVLSYEAYATNFEVVLESIEFLLYWNITLDGLACFKRFSRLRGTQTILQIIGIASKWKSLSYKGEVISAALDCLFLLMCSVRSQHILEQPVTLSPSEKKLGMRLVLGAAVGSLVDEPDVIKAALRIICYCCMPLNMKRTEVGCDSMTVELHLHRVMQVPYDDARLFGQTVIDVKRMQALIRKCNGIDALLSMLDISSPLTDADAIRALACKGLYYLSSDIGIRQILGKLTLFQSEKLQQLMREPILPENAAEHAKFCHHASLLIEQTTGTKFLNQTSTLPIWSRLARANVVSETKINYPKKDLLTLINDHLLSNGLVETAKMLQQEAHLSTSSVNGNSTPAFETPKRKSTMSMMQSPALRGSPQAAAFRQSLCSHSPRAASKSVFATTALPSAPADDDSQVTLDNIVTQFLREQHAQCKNPVKTCPPFSLLRHHRCPEPRHRRKASVNVTRRLVQRQLSGDFWGHQGASLDRKLIYSRFKPFAALRDTEDSCYFTSASFVPNSEYVALGTFDGVVQLYNVSTMQQEIAYQILVSTVTNCEISRDGKHMIASSSDGYPMSGVWGLDNLRLLDRKVDMPEDHYATFSNDQEKLIGTKDKTANIYDLFTGKRVASLREPNELNNYLKNVAVFNPTDDLVLNDGCLWDLRGKRMIHQFDKLDYLVSGVFNPNGLEIIIGSQIWDVRTFRLLRTVPALDRSRMKFNRAGNVMFSLKHVSREDEFEFNNEQGRHPGPFTSSFRTFDACEYSSIGIVLTKKTILDLAVDANDSLVAVIENSGQPDHLNAESACRLYEIGRQRRVSGEDSDDEQDEDREDDRDDSDGDDDDDDDDVMGGFSDNFSSELLSSSGDDDDFGTDSIYNGSSLTSSDDSFPHPHDSDESTQRWVDLP